MSEASTRKLQATTMTDALIRKVMETDPNSTPYSLDVHNKQIRHLSNLEVREVLGAQRGGWGGMRGGVRGAKEEGGVRGGAKERSDCTSVQRRLCHRF